MMSAEHLEDGPSREVADFRAWCYIVLAAEAMADWQIKPGEAYCWITNRTIQFPANSTDHANFLHEVAHAGHPEPEGEHKNHYHGGGWFCEFQRLVNKWLMPRPIGEEAAAVQTFLDCEDRSWIPWYPTEAEQSAIRKFLMLLLHGDNST